MYSGINPFSEDYTGEGAGAYLMVNQDMGILLGYVNSVEGIGTTSITMGCGDGPGNGIITGISIQLIEDSSAKHKTLTYRYNDLGISVLDSINEIGLVGDSYYGENYTDNTYVQKNMLMIFINQFQGITLG